MSIENLKLAYLALSALMIFIIAIIGFNAINQSTSKGSSVKKKIILIVGLLTWQAFVFIAAKSGILDNFRFPPRFFLFLILPLFLFTGIFLFKSRNSKWIKYIPKHWLAFYQSFRIFVESIFVASVSNGILNPEVTILGYNYDMIFAYSALLVGFLSYKNILSNRLLLVWNYLGLAVIASIIFLFQSSVYFPQLFGSDNQLLPIDAVKYPYVLVAGFLMPSAVFMHVLSIVQLRAKN